MGFKGKDTKSRHSSVSDPSVEQLVNSINQLNTTALMLSGSLNSFIRHSERKRKQIIVCSALLRSMKQMSEDKEKNIPELSK